MAFACPKLAIRKVGAPLKSTDPQTQKPPPAATARNGVCAPMIHPASQPRRDAAPGASWTNLRPPGAILAEHHARYLEARGVTLEVARAAGYWTARRPSEHPPAFSAQQRRRHPALVAPHYSPDGETVSWQKRDDRPGTDRKGKPAKWVSPKAEKARTV